MPCALSFTRRDSNLRGNSHGIGSGRRGSAGHDCNGLAGLYCESNISCSGLDFANYTELGWKPGQIDGAHGVSITSSAGEWREIAVRRNHLSEDLTSAVEQFHQLFPMGAKLGSMLLHGVAGIFKTQDSLGCRH